MLLLNSTSNAQTLINASGSSNAFSIVYPANLGGVIPPGMLVVFKSNHSITGNATLDVNGIGPVVIKKQFDKNLESGDIASGQFVSVIFDNTSNAWQMLSVQANPPAGVNYWSLSGSNLFPQNTSQTLALGTSQSSASLTIKGKSTTTSSYALVITNSADGINFVARDDGFVGIGTTAPGYLLHVNGRVKSNGINETSDIRLKEQIVPLTNALQRVMLLQGVMYAMKKNSAEQKSIKREIGLIAQEVEKVYPELVSTGNDGYKSLEYSRISAVLIEAIKEQQQQLEKSNAAIQSLQRDMAELQTAWQKQYQLLQLNYPTKSEK